MVVRLTTSVALALRQCEPLAACEHIVALVDAFVDASPRWDVPRAARYGFLHLLQRFAAQQEPPTLTAQQLACAVEIAASRGHLAVLQWAHTQPHHMEAFSVKVMNYAACYGHLALVQWLHAHRHEGASTKAMDGAACCGHLEMVRWLHTYRTEGCTVDAMNSAVVNGHLAVVQFLHFHRTEGCTPYAMDVAVANADLPMLEFLHAHRTEGCSANAVKHALRGRGRDGRGGGGASARSVLMLQWLYERYRALFTESMWRLCVQSGRVDVVQWVRSLGVVTAETMDPWLTTEPRGRARGGGGRGGE